jgi:hypothetical protein
METTYFRFSGKKAPAGEVYGTAIISLFSTSALFRWLFRFLLSRFGFLGYEAHPEYIRMFAWIVAIDAFSAIRLPGLETITGPGLQSAEVI